MKTNFEILTSAIQQYIDHLAAITYQHFSEKSLIIENFVIATQHVLQACKEYENNEENSNIITARKYFQNQTEQWFCQSYFMSRMRKKQNGYLDDFETIEAIYKGIPVSQNSIGFIIDTYFLASEFAIAVRERRAKLRELILAELTTMSVGASILNIACGFCRELFDIANDINVYKPFITCIDNNVKAIETAKRLLQCCGILSNQIKFINYQPIYCLKSEQKIKSLSEQNLIYSLSLFDCINDDELVKILKTLYNLLLPCGRLIAPFIDHSRYDNTALSWLANWTGIFARTKESINLLLEKAGIPQSSIWRCRDKSGAILFHVITKSEKRD